MTNSNSSSPPIKRIKAEPTSSQGPKQTGGNAKVESLPPAARATEGWGNYAAHIAQDDKKMVVKAREQLKHLGGETFRPELRETYKDQNGKKEIKVHEKSEGSADRGVSVRSQDKEVVKEEEKEPILDTVVVDRAYDSDSSDGGIALSPSSLENDSWVVIKTGDENASWKRA